VSWEQLMDILHQSRAGATIDLSEPPVACPYDGEPLDVHPDGRRNCPLGNYTYTGGPKIQ